MQTPVRTKRTPERTEGWTAEDLAVFWYETAEQQQQQAAGERNSDPEALRPGEVRTLVAQCSILLVIAGIVAGLIAA